MAEKRFVFEQVAGGYRCSCNWCGEGSGVLSTKSKTTKWSQRHAMAEFEMDLPDMVAYMKGRTDV